MPVMVLTPLVVASWPAITSAVLAAAVALGYTVKKTQSANVISEAVPDKVELVVKNTETVGESLMSEETLAFEKEGIVLSFKKNPSGKCSVSVCGKSLSREELTRRGNEFAQKVVQQYVYNKVVSELKGRGFSVVNDEIQEDKSIKIMVRRWH